MGGNNIFQYAPNPTVWIDPFGLKKCTKPSIWSKKGWKHIYERHRRATRSKWSHKSKFKGDEKSIKKLINKSVNRGTATKDGQRYGRTKYTYNTGKEIGRKYDKNTDTYEIKTQVTVILDKFNKVVTAFPSSIN